MTKRSKPERRAEQLIEAFRLPLEHNDGSDRPDKLWFREDRRGTTLILSTGEAAVGITALNPMEWPSTGPIESPS